MALPAQPLDWRSYIAGPQTRLVTPASIEWSVAGGGSITNGTAALVEDGTSARLAWGGSGTTPLLAIDFGLPISGKVEVVFGDTTTASLGLAFSQRLEFLDIGSDTDSFCLGDLAVTGRPGLTWRTDSRRGFRYVLLYLNSPGTVDIDAVRLYHTPFLATPDTYDGHFLCNEDLLNRIWYGCAYTQEICTTSGLGCDGDWEIEDGALSVSNQGDGEIGLSIPGSNWTDYALDFDLVIRPKGGLAGWIFRAVDQNNCYMWQLASRHASTPNQIRRHVRQNGSYTSITTVNLVPPIEEGVSYHIRMELAGTTIRTWLNGNLIDTFTHSVFSQGRIGFRASGTEHFHVDNVAVTQNSNTLFSDDFTSEFQAADRSKWTRAEILTINDGAKRDRVWVWGDFFPAQRTMYAAHWLPDIIEETLRDGAQHQYTAQHEAQWGGILEGKIPAANGGQYMTDSGFAIKWLDDYTLWWVLTLHHHWMRTGDDAFMAEMYPALQKVLTWCQRKSAGNGLINVQLGDWYWSFLRQGQITAFNALYIQSLRCGIQMANTLGNASDAATWTVRANAAESALNSLLFDSGQGLYYDGDADHAHYPLDANTLPLVFGLTPANRVPSILDQIEQLMWTSIGTRTSWPSYGTWGHDHQIWAWYVQYESEARFLNNDDARALESIRRPWGHMVNSDPGRTMWEFMMGDGTLESGLRNTDHAFSSGAAWLLSEYAAGIRPTSPGFEAFDIIPHPGSLVWVDATVPSPLGLFRNYYNVDRAGLVYDATITIPPGATGRAAVPRLGTKAIVYIDGNLAWSLSGPVGAATSDNAYLYFPGMGPGAHRINARFDVNDSQATFSAF